MNERTPDRKKNKKIEGKKKYRFPCALWFKREVMVVAVELLVDDQQEVLDHVDSPSIACSTTEDNGSCDKINQQPMNNVHIVHFHAKMDQCQAKLHSHYTNTHTQTFSLLTSL